MKKMDHYQKKLLLLKLAKKYKNVSRACEELGVSRQHYYDMLKLYNEGGTKALKNSGRNKPHYKKRFSAEIENKVLKIAKEHPEWGQLRVCKLLNEEKVKISIGGVRCIWLRHNLDTKEKRIAFSKKASKV
ncbi:MAG TPA: helix-turn-helix domain-containing protein [Ignavibacteria bacterium]|jgi:transposase